MERRLMPLKSFMAKLNQGWNLAWFCLSDDCDFLLKADLCVNWRLHDQKTMFVEVNISDFQDRDAKHGFLRDLQDKATSQWRENMSECLLNSIENL